MHLGTPYAEDTACEPAHVALHAAREPSKTPHCAIGLWEQGFDGRGPREASLDVDPGRVPADAEPVGSCQLLQAASAVLASSYPGSSRSPGEETSSWWREHETANKAMSDTRPWLLLPG